MSKKAEEKICAGMLTPEGEALLAEKNTIPWNEYPRPHLRRRSFICLNGAWELTVKGTTAEKKQRITVPFVPQSVLSGVDCEITDDDILIYRKSFSYKSERPESRVLLHVDGADREAEVELNGVAVGRHSGGYDGFTVDVSRHIGDENILEIRVTDDHKSCTSPYGKQREKRGGMWYTPVSGIWQSVWLEEVPGRYISEIRVESDLSGASVTVEMSDGIPLSGSVTFSDSGKERRVDIVDGRARLEPTAPELWTPDTPHLYDFSVKVGEDEVESYFALRTVTVDGGRICLNGQPYFFHGLLDQGYFSDGIFRPASPEGFERDIKKAKELGFNTLRKHIKIEPELFYYACDRLGMIVFQDMVNCGKYSFLRDTALPTVGFKRKNDKRIHRDPKTRSEFLSLMRKTVKRLSFHPSVCYWTIFNEGWGQFDHAAAYGELKKLDPSRPIDSVSGWFSSREGTVSDVESPHIYFKSIKLTRAERPTVISEFGGYSYKVEGHSFNLKDNYGYGVCADGDELMKALTDLYENQVIPAIRSGLCGTVYTQLTDVEDETNGLMTYDRRVTKVSPEGMRAIAEKLKAAFEE